MIGGAGVYLLQNQNQNSGILSSQQAAQTAMDFINQTIEEENVTASLMDVIEESGVYKIHLKIAESEYESYITKDGKILFSFGFDVEEQPAQEEQKEQEVENLDSFAQCLTDKGLKFYGSKNCGWCEKQKELFGDSLQYVEYIECIDPQTDQWSELCREAGIDAVPTWEIAGEMSSGFKTLEQLSDLSGCSSE